MACTASPHNSSQSLSPIVIPDLIRGSTCLDSGPFRANPRQNSRGLTRFCPISVPPYCSREQKGLPVLPGCNYSVCREQNRPPPLPGTSFAARLTLLSKTAAATSRRGSDGRALELICCFEVIRTTVRLVILCKPRCNNQDSHRYHRPGHLWRLSVLQRSRSLQDHLDRTKLNSPNLAKNRQAFRPFVCPVRRIAPFHPQIRALAWMATESTQKGPRPRFGASLIIST